MDCIVELGERLSCRIVASALQSRVGNYFLYSPIDFNLNFSSRGSRQSSCSFMTSFQTT
jgi:aspartokinase